MSTSTIGFEEEMGQGSRDYGQEAMLRHVGALAKQRREELGVGRVPFAKQAGIGSDRTVFDFEIGKNVPTPITARRMEKALGWRSGVVMELLRDENRRVSDVRMEELDEYDSAPVSTLASIPTAQLLEEVIKRLSTIQAGIGLPTQDMLGLAASGGHKPEHLDDDPDDDISGLNISPN